MKRLELGMIVRLHGKLAEVTGIGEGRTIHLRYFEEKPCPTCGCKGGVNLLEHAPLLQDNLQPVDTVQP